MGGHDIEAAAFVRFDPPRRVRSGASPPVGAAVSTPPYHYRKWPHLGLIRNSNNGMTVNTFAILSCANRRHADRTTAAPPPCTFNASSCAQSISIVSILGCLFEGSPGPRSVH
jgi:hypothetical protein